MSETTGEPLPDGRVIITIDGPAGTGKSTVAHRLARRLGLEFLDTGAMYRAAAVIAVERGLDPDDGGRLAAAVRAADLRFDWSGDPPAISIDGRDVSDRIRDLDVSSVVSRVAAQQAVRDVLVEAQREIAVRHPRLVTEGRDQGSVVFPDAPLRFFLDANAEVRARRRVSQLEAAGKSVDLEIVMRNITERDSRDAGRAAAPLREPEGGIVIDTSEMTLEEVVDRLEATARARFVEDGRTS